MKVLSLGLGVQSTALYYMSSLGELPRLDYAIFADLGKEKKKTYEYLEYLLAWERENNGIPIIVLKEKNLYQDLINGGNESGHGFASIPAYTRSKDNKVGMLRRQCTREYKIACVDKEIRRLYGAKPYQRLPLTEVWKGISLDEIERISIPYEAWKSLIHPFCGYGSELHRNAFKLDYGKNMTRAQISDWYQAHEIPEPPKSSCVFCPYQSEKAWYDMKTNEPQDFMAAIEVDAAIRNRTKEGIKNPIFLHESCQPLEAVSFKDQENDLWKGECSGNCHL
jgi:hypothetical protein